jgi:hypothetical protein
LALIPAVGDGSQKVWIFLGALEVGLVLFLGAGHLRGLTRNVSRFSGSNGRGGGTKEAGVQSSSAEKMASCCVDTSTLFGYCRSCDIFGRILYVVAIPRIMKWKDTVSRKVTMK